MNWSSFTDAAVTGVPLVFVIVGLVYWFKEFKAQDGSPLFTGNQILIISMIWGVLIGGGYQVFKTPLPEDPGVYPLYTYWFAVLVYGVAMGLVASGLYSTVKSLVEKQFDKLLQAMALDKVLK